MSTTSCLQTTVHNISKNCVRNSVQTVKALLEMGADVSCRDQEGNTPLHYAVELDHAQIARALLRHGANVMAANTEGFTPATLVERLGATECAEAVKEVARRISEESAADLLSHNTRAGLRR
jgi:protein phosphatase 1 regulatory subunit 16A